MPSFQYRALQPNGVIAEGEIEAGGRQEAFRQMEGRGLRPISLAERNGANGAVKSPAKLAAISAVAVELCNVRVIPSPAIRAANRFSMLAPRRRRSTAP